jgi:hypothetical protein
MSGIGEAILVELVTTILFKSIKVAGRIMEDSRNFLDDRHDFHVRLSVQVARLNEVARLLDNPLVSTNIEVRDRHTYYHVTQKLHRLLLDYIIKTSPAISDHNRFVAENSAEELFREIELKVPELSDPSLAQEKFWLRTKERVTWVLYKKQNIEKLVVGVESGGNCPADLFSINLPAIFVRMHLSSTEIARNTPGEELATASIKSRILIEKRAYTEGHTPTMAMFRNDTIVSSTLQYSQLRFPSQATQLENTGKYKEPDDGCHLGGTSRRQWAQLYDDRGCLQEARVIVELKDRQSGELLVQASMDDVRRELVYCDLHRLRRSFGC